MRRKRNLPACAAALAARRGTPPATGSALRRFKSVEFMCRTTKKAPCWVLLFGGEAGTQYFAKKDDLQKVQIIDGGERGIWTLATILSYYSLSRGAPSASWVFLRIHVLYFIWRYPPLKNWRRRWDSNPRYLAVSLVFKTSSLNPSDTSPRNLMHTDYIKVIFECQPSHKIILFFCFFVLL